MIKVTNNVKNFFASFREATVFLIIVVLCIITSMLSPAFLTWSNIKTTMLGLCSNGLMTIGMTIVLISGGMDLSVGSVMASASVICGICIVSGVPVVIAIILAIIVGILFGLLNALLIAKTTIAPMIITLGTMQIGRGLALVLTSGTPQSVATAPEAFLFLGKGQIGEVPFLILFFIVVAIVFDILLRKSTAMRKIYYIGSNEDSARLSGINVVKTKLSVYALSGALAGVAGVLTTARFSTATPTTGLGAEMICISAAVIGGASTAGGEGTVLGSVLGIIMVNIINNALVLLNVSVYWQDLISGVILILAVLFDYLSHRKKL
ncbi:MAG: ABC transporter permease [Christensenellales bacterium]